MDGCKTPQPDEKALTVLFSAFQSDSDLEISRSLLSDYVNGYDIQFQSQKTFFNPDCP